MREMMKNKKSATPIAIILIVLMTLMLSLFALFVFLKSSKLDKTIANANFISEVYAREKQIKFYLSNIGEKILKESYEEVEREQEGLPEKYSEEEFNKKIEEKAREKFKEQLSKRQDNKEDFAYGIKERVAKNDYSIRFDGKKLVLEFKNFKIIMIKQITENKIKWFYVIPAGKYEDILEQFYVVYEKDLIIERKKAQN